MVLPNLVSLKGVSLLQAKEKGQLVFLEGLKDCLGVVLPDGAKPESPTLDFFRWSSMSSGQHSMDA